MRHDQPVLAVRDTTREHHDYGPPPKQCTRCGIVFGTLGELCLDCLDVLRADEPPIDPATMQPPTVVLTANGGRHVLVGRRTGSTQAQKPVNEANVRRLRARNLNDREIALQLGLSDTTVYRIRKRLGLPAVLQQPRPATAYRRAS